MEKLIEKTDLPVDFGLRCLTQLKWMALKNSFLMDIDRIWKHCASKHKANPDFLSTVSLFQDAEEANTALGIIDDFLEVKQISIPKQTPPQNSQKTIDLEKVFKKMSKGIEFAKPSTVENLLKRILDVNGKA